MISFKKVGGLRFLTIGRLNLSWSVTSKAKMAARALERQMAHDLNFTLTIHALYERAMVRHYELVTAAERYAIERMPNEWERTQALAAHDLMTMAR